jgi:hypothetical protein
MYRKENKNKLTIMPKIAFSPLDNSELLPLPFKTKTACANFRKTIHLLPVAGMLNSQNSGGFQIACLRYKTVCFHDECHRISRS